MGTVNKAKCRECKDEFEFSTGGGSNFAIINCDSCHRTKSISLKEKETAEEHEECECGGIFRNNAKVRCRNCESDKIEDKSVKIYFD